MIRWRAESTASGPCDKNSSSAGRGALAAVVGAGVLPALVGILSAFGGMSVVGGVGLEKGKDEMVMVIEMAC